MPAIQAMRSDALAARSKEDVKEKIPSFFNSVNQALGQNIIKGQDNAEQLIQSRFQAANALAAEIRKKVDAQGSLAEMTAGGGMKLVSSAVSTFLAVLSKTDTRDIIDVIRSITEFILKRQEAQLQWRAVAATFAQWTVQAGFTGNGEFFDGAEEGSAMGGRGAIMYRDSFTPRWTDQRFYNRQDGSTINYASFYNWGSVGSISRMFHYDTTVNGSAAYRNNT
ncbi:MAG: hypothetical protein IGS03_01710 [Candidatus Sericytochromatia bacterium]|nr:hypothetical protein [Candidatus Sericytochromatia bacterium]